mmetsp:Transcript_36800/g.87425  ORF Transcript_36800/g.87425 Transcript_36800/m.87425 type:complete len:152 (-) Transcript_36800:59-514(-)
MRASPRHGGRGRRGRPPPGISRPPPWPEASPHVRVFDLQTGSEVMSFIAADDTVNGFHFHPTLPLAATGSGHRRYPLAPLSDSEDEGAQPATMRGNGLSMGANSNCLRLWRFGAGQLAADGNGDDRAPSLPEADPGTAVGQPTIEAEAIPP